MKRRHGRDDPYDDPEHPERRQLRFTSRDDAFKYDWASRWYLTGHTDEPPMTTTQEHKELEEAAKRHIDADEARKYHDFYLDEIDNIAKTDPARARRMLDEATKHPLASDDELNYIFQRNQQLGYKLADARRVQEAQEAARPPPVQNRFRRIEELSRRTESLTPEVEPDVSLRKAAALLALRRGDLMPPAEGPWARAFVQAYRDNKGRTFTEMWRDMHTRRMYIEPLMHFQLFMMRDPGLRREVVKNNQAFRQWSRFVDAQLQKDWDALIAPDDVTEDTIDLLGDIYLANDAIHVIGEMQKIVSEGPPFPEGRDQEEWREKLVGQALQRLKAQGYKVDGDSYNYIDDWTANAELVFPRPAPWSLTPYRNEEGFRRANAGYIADEWEDAAPSAADAAAM